MLQSPPLPVKERCWRREMAVTWKEVFAVVELGLWLILSMTDIAKTLLRIFGGQTTCSPRARECGYCRCSSPGVTICLLISSFMCERATSSLHMWELVSPVQHRASVSYCCAWCNWTSAYVKWRGVVWSLMPRPSKTMLTRASSSEGINSNSLYDPLKWVQLNQWKRKSYCK